MRLRELEVLERVATSSPGLKGFGTPFCAGRAGTFFFSIFTRPGIAITPAPLLPRLSLISAARAQFAKQGVLRQGHCT
jgi:hypothetical protein